MSWSSDTISTSILHLRYHFRSRRCNSRRRPTSASYLKIRGKNQRHTNTHTLKHTRAIVARKKELINKLFIFIIFIIAIITHYN